MPVRPTMSDLIQRLRLLIHDPAGTDQTFSDEELQGFLDARRTDHLYRRLTALYTVGPDFTPQILAATSMPVGDWEEGAVLTGPDYVPISPATADYRRGIWTFSAHQPEPIRITGRTFDLAAAGADALEAWAARLKAEYDFRTADYEFEGNQRVAGILRLAAALRCRQKPRTVTMMRSDQC